MTDPIIERAHMIIRHFKQVLTFCIIALCFTISSRAIAQESWSVLVVPEYDSDSLNASHRAYRTAGAKIRDKLATEFDMDVYSGQTRNINLFCQKQCDENSRTDIINALREANEITERAPIDLVVFYHILSKDLNSSVGKKKLIRISNLAIDIETGKTVVYDDGDQQQAEFIKQSDDLTNWTVTIANRHARDSAAYIGERLNAYERKIEYQLKMVDFAPSALMRFEKHLAMHRSNQNARMTLKDTQEKKKQLLHSLATNTYYLKSPMGGGKLKNVMGRFFDDEGLSITLSYGGNTSGIRHFQVKHVGVAFLHLYILAAISLLLALIILVISLNYRKHYHVLARYGQEKKVSTGLAHLKARRLAILPETKKWKDWREKWLKAEQQSQSDLKEAKQSMVNHDYQKASELAERAATSNTDLTEAIELARVLPAYKEGYEAFIEGKANVSVDPSDAAKQLTKAQALNPLIAEQVTDLIHRSEHNLRQGELASRFTSAEKAIEANNGYLALSHIDAAVFFIEGLDDFNEEAIRLRSMRTKALGLFQPILDVAKLDGALLSVSLIAKDEILIGRPSSSAVAEIEINFKRISRPGKQTKLQRQGRSLVAIDLGSTHGTAIEGEFMNPNEPYPLRGRTVLAIGGDKSKSSQGACRLVMQSINDSSSILVRFDQQSLALLDQTQLGKAWLTLEEDLQKKWLCLNDEVPVGEMSGQLDIGCIASETPLFYFTKEKGSGIGIRSIHSGESAVLSINNIEVNGKVPLQQGAEITIKQHRFSIV